MENELRPFWRKAFNFNWQFGLLLILVVCIPRFILVLYANTSGNYGSIGAIMVASAIAPFIFLTRSGRKAIGIVKTSKYRKLIIAFISGLAFSLLLYYAGRFLYGDTYQNWYNYIGKSYNIPPGISGKDKTILFIVVAITGMIFSPVGEELFFRGIVHAAFAKSIGERKATVVDAAAFALVHISHFGLVFVNNQWKFLAVPTLIWITGMFSISILFVFFKKYAGSIVGAIICHSAFNLGMTYCIFYLL